MVAPNPGTGVNTTIHLSEPRTKIFTLLAGLSYINHIHFLDFDCLASGQGHMDMEGLYRAVDKAGYVGYLCLEVLPRLSSDA